MTKFYLTLATVAVASSAAFAAAPVVQTHSYVARGCDFALGRIISEEKLSKSGFCYSDVNPEPTIEDKLSDKKYDNNGTIYRMSDLTPSTWYYVRAYGINAAGEVGYGNVVKVVTIPKGTITYSYNPGADGTEEINARIIAACEGAMDAWNSATSISGFHATVNYSPGTPTADCSYGGWIRMGANASYQRVGTLLHEMNHGVGVGQHSIWYGPDSPYRESGTSGTWRAKRANDLVAFLENDKNAKLKGDGTHMWPYGINGAHEDTGSEFLYLANGMITQALHEDALPPVANKFHPGSYNLSYEPGQKFYLKNEAVEREVNYLYEDADNTLTYIPMTAAEALADDNAAWTFEFDPVTCTYTVKNVGTGNLLVWNKGTKIGTKAAADVVNGYEKFVLSEWVRYPKINGENISTFWLSCIMSLSHNAASLSATKDGAIKTTQYNMTNTGDQRWYILPESKLESWNGGNNVEEVVLHEALPTFPGDVYDISGRLVKRNAENLDDLANGIYIVNGRKFVK